MTGGFWVSHSVILSICREQELIYLCLLMLLTCNQFQKKPSEIQQVRVLSSLAHWPFSQTPDGVYKGHSSSSSEQRQQPQLKTKQHHGEARNVNLAFAVKQGHLH